MPEPAGLQHRAQAVGDVLQQVLALPVQPGDRAAVHRDRADRLDAVPDRDLDDRLRPLIPGAAQV